MINSPQKINLHFILRTKKCDPLFTYVDKGRVRDILDFHFQNGSDNDLWWNKNGIAGMIFFSSWKFLRLVEKRSLLTINTYKFKDGLRVEYADL